MDFARAKVGGNEKVSFILCKLNNDESDNIYTTLYLWIDIV